MNPSFYDRLRARRRELLIFVALSSLYFFSFFQRVAVPGTVFDELQVAFGISASAVTALAAIYLYIYAGMQLAVGAAADRFGPSKMLLVGGLLLGLGSVAFPLSPSLPLLYLSRALVAFGGSFMYLCIVKEIDQLFAPRHFAPLLGVLMVFGYSGGMTGTAPLERAVRAFGWRWSLLGVGMLCCLALALAAALLRRARRTKPVAPELSFVGIKDLFRTKTLYAWLLTGPIGFAVYFLLQATVGKKFLQDCCGASSAGAARVTFAMLLVMMAGSFVSGFLPRLIGERRKPIVVGATAVVALSAILLLVGARAGASTGWFAGCFLAIALAISAGPVGTALLKEFSPASTTAFALGFGNAVVYLIVGGLNNFAGAVLDAFREKATVTAEAIIYPHQAYQVVFLVLAAMSVCALIASWFLSETRGVQRAR